MKTKFLPLLKWLIPLGFFLLALLFSYAIHGHSFLGLVSAGIGGIISCYYLIDLLRRRYRLAGKVLNTVLTALLILGIAVFAVTEAIIIHASFGDPDTGCEYVIVLGAKVNGTQPSLSLNDRIHATYDYLTAHPETIAILSGGQGPDEGVSEAQCMFRELTDKGISPERLWLEDKATSTWENLKFSLDLIEEKTGIRPKTVGLLSSEYHLFRAGLFAARSGVDTVGIPAQTSWPSIRINYFMREVAGIWHYLILGGQYHD